MSVGDAAERETSPRGTSGLWSWPIAGTGTTRQACPSQCWINGSSLDWGELVDSYFPTAQTSSRDTASTAAREAPLPC